MHALCDDELCPRNVVFVAQNTALDGIGVNKIRLTKLNMKQGISKNSAKKLNVKTNSVVNPSRFGCYLDEPEALTNRECCKSV